MPPLPPAGQDVAPSGPHQAGEAGERAEDGELGVAGKEEDGRGRGRRRPLEGGESARVATLERAGRAAVGGSLGGEGRQARSRVVDDERARLVADRPARLGEAPEEVDVLPDGQRLVEAPDGKERGAAHAQGGAGEVADAGARGGAPGAGAEVEGRGHGLVGGERRRLEPRPDGPAAGAGAHPCTDRGDDGVREVREQRGQPARRGQDVGVEERDDLALRERRPRVAGRGGSPGRCPAEQPRPCTCRCRGDVLGARRAVVDDDHAGEAPALPRAVEGGEALEQVADPRVVAHGDDDRDVAGAGGRTSREVGRGMERAGIEQAAGEGADRPGRRAGPVEEGVERRLPCRRQPPHPQRRPAEEERAGPRGAGGTDPARRGVEDVAPAGRRRRAALSRRRRRRGCSSRRACPGSRR
jgi:hypothetical protein